MALLNTKENETLRPSRHRHRSSSAELLALFREGTDETARIESHAWPGVRLVALELTGTGRVHLPCVDFFSVVTFAGDPPNIALQDWAGPAQPSDKRQSVVIGAAQGVDYEWSSYHRAYWVCLEAELIESIAATCGVEAKSLRQLRRSYDPAVDGCDFLVAALEREARLDSHATQSAIVGSVSRALACWLVGHCTTGGHVPTSPRGALGYRPFERVRNFIDENLSSKISLEELAEVAGISRFHFARQFRLRTGESPLGYVLRMRIERAKLLLRDSNSRVCDIAAELGFSDQSHFTRTFKRMVGMPPSRYSDAHERAAPSRPLRSKGFAEAAMIATH